jgi:hypothetical protein
MPPISTKTSRAPEERMLRSAGRAPRASLAVHRCSTAPGRASPPTSSATRAAWARTRRGRRPRNLGAAACSYLHDDLDANKASPSADRVLCPIRNFPLTLTKLWRCPGFSTCPCGCTRDASETAKRHARGRRGAQCGLDFPVTCAQ